MEERDEQCKSENGRLLHEQQVGTYMNSHYL